MLPTPRTTSTRPTIRRRRTRRLGEGDVVAQRLDRRDPRGPARGEVGRHDRDADPHDVRPQDGRRLDDERRPARSSPISPKSPGRPAPTGSRAPRPMVEPSRPTAKASRITEPVIWRREAPRVRIRASSRLRWATRIEKVLTIRKMPTTRDIPAKTSRKVGRKRDRLRAGRCVLLDDASPVTGHDPVGQDPPPPRRAARPGRPRRRHPGDRRRRLDRRRSGPGLRPVSKSVSVAPLRRAAARRSRPARPARPRSWVARPDVVDLETSPTS